VPDAEVDEICAAFYSFQNPDKDQSSIFTCETGQVIVQTAQVDQIKGREPRADMVATELDLINRVVDIICDIDPDILIGWEVQAASWGYLKSRGQHYGMFATNLDE
jgi:DNA polymerase zeta